MIEDSMPEISASAPPVLSVHPVHFVHRVHPVQTNADITSSNSEPI